MAPNRRRKNKSRLTWYAAFRCLGHKSSPRAQIGAARVNRRRMSKSAPYELIAACGPAVAFGSAGNEESPASIARAHRSPVDVYRELVNRELVYRRAVGDGRDDPQIAAARTNRG